MSKTLLLLRHAKSSWDDPRLADHDRPLAPRGRRASELIAAHLRAHRITPGLVLCSSSARTRETLARIWPGLAGEVEVEIEEGLYGASADDLLTRLHQLSSNVESLMVIGHAPAIPELARRLAGCGADLARLEGKFPTAALAMFSFEGSWQGLLPGTAELVDFVKPRELEALQRGDSVKRGFDATPSSGPTWRSPWDP
jgi:phosphohistidine phosphatase